MYNHQYGGPPPAPAPSDYHSRRRYPSPPDRREGTREGRSRTQDKTGQGRRFRSSDPIGSNRQGRIIETNSNQSEILTRRTFDEAAGGRRRKEAEALLVREVEELKGRAVQMEKTMRWWSECAANWRDKWTKVRLERNKAIEEAREMRSKAGRIEKERDRVRIENKMLRMEMEEIKLREDRQMMTMGTISSCRTQEINEGYDKKVMKRQSSCENILDATYNTRSAYSLRPRSVGTVPGKTSLMNSVASDPCLLFSITYDISHESTEETIGTNSLDSGVLVEPQRMGSKIDWYSREREVRSELNMETNKSENPNTNCKKCKSLQKLLSSKEKEFSHLKQGHHRLQQVLAEKGSELSRAIRRAENTERELKKLKLKMQESKKSGIEKKGGENNHRSTLKNKKTNHTSAQNEGMKQNETEKDKKGDDKKEEARELINDTRDEGMCVNAKDDSKFSEAFVQAIGEDSFNNDFHCCLKKDNITSQASVEMIESNPYQADTVEDPLNSNHTVPKEKNAENKRKPKSPGKEMKGVLNDTDIEHGDAVYASVNKNRKIEKKQLMLVTK